MFELTRLECMTLEEELDRLLLKQSMGGFIREFDGAQVWRKDPTLHVKIPLFATDHILSRPAEDPAFLRQSLFSLFDQIPAFLNSAIQTLDSPPEISLQIAQNMTDDAIRFYRTDVPTFIGDVLGENHGLVEKNGKALESWERFRKNLSQLTTSESFAMGEDAYRAELSAGLSYSRSLEEILEIVESEYRKTGEKLLALAKRIDAHKGWQSIIYEQGPRVSSQSELVQLFESHVRNLRRFFGQHDVLPSVHGGRLKVQQTPSYLRSLRAAASYRAPLTGDKEGRDGIFYITPGSGDLKLIASHSPYVTAHEAIPGHHTLDQIRIHHTNAIRRQIESPFFYEGWACYAEQLLDELGFIRNQRQRLVGLKRQLWRNLRAILDIELQTGKTNLVQGTQRIVSLGFSNDRAQRQIRRFVLTPGYQVCYALGMHEIISLRGRYGSRLDLKDFHDSLLDGGQLAFDLVERRIAARAEA